MNWCKRQKRWRGQVLGPWVRSSIRWCKSKQKRSGYVLWWQINASKFCKVDHIKKTYSAKNPSEMIESGADDLMTRSRPLDLSPQGTIFFSTPFVFFNIWAYWYHVWVGEFRFFFSWLRLFFKKLNGREILTTARHDLLGNDCHFTQRCLADYTPRITQHNIFRLVLNASLPFM